VNRAVGRFVEDLEPILAQGRYELPTLTSMELTAARAAAGLAEPGMPRAFFDDIPAQDEASGLASLVERGLIDDVNTLDHELVLLLTLRQLPSLVLLCQTRTRSDVGPIWIFYGMGDAAYLLESVSNAKHSFTLLNRARAIGLLLGAVGSQGVASAAGPLVVEGNPDAAETFRRVAETTSVLALQGTRWTDRPGSTSFACEIAAGDGVYFIVGLPAGGGFRRAAMQLSAESLNEVVARALACEERLLAPTLG